MRVARWRIRETAWHTRQLACQFSVPRVLSCQVNGRGAVRQSNTAPDNAAASSSPCQSSNYLTPPRLPRLLIGFLGLCRAGRAFPGFAVLGCFRWLSEIASGAPRGRIQKVPLPRRGTEVTPMDAASFRHDDGMYARGASTERRLSTAFVGRDGVPKNESASMTLYLAELSIEAGTVIGSCGCPMRQANGCVNCSF